MMSSSSPERPVLCTICDSKGVLLCVQCRSVRYCSIECQRTDWPTHKLLCGSFISDFSVPPGPKLERAILFPVDENLPKFIWVEVVFEYDEETGVNVEIPKLNALLGAGNPVPGRCFFRRNILRDRDLDHTIVVVHLKDGSVPNQSIIKVTKGGAAHRWAGPVVAFRTEGLGFDPPYGDITLSDFRHTIDYCLTYHKNRMTGGLQIGCKANKKCSERRCSSGLMEVAKGIKGVRISCEADQRVLMADKYIPVDVPDFQDPVFAMKEPAGISRLIELPILVFKYPPDQAWRNDPRVGSYNNQAVTFLHLNVDPKSSNFGWAPPLWQTEVGSVLAVRADRKPLSPHHMQAICHFSQFQMQPLFEDSLGGGFVERTRNNDESQIREVLREIPN